MRKNKGITLIALVITVIILIILAGASISMLTGENGILKRATEAKSKMEEAQNNEKTELDAIMTQMEMQQKGAICNSPDLKTGMIPVKWDEGKKSWVKAKKDNSGNDWYDYSTSSKKWANVVTVKETGTKTRQQYMDADAETPIAEDDITTMFVWIPRYAYKIVKGYHSTGNGEVSIKWLVGTTDAAVDGTTGIKRTSQTDKNYVVHPAFTNDTSLGGSGKEVEGFWVGKFESSNVNAVKDNANMNKNTIDENTLYGIGDKETVTIRPNVTSWRAISVSNIMQKSQNMTKANNIHGLSSSDTTTTMMQNSQWGAVAYLTQSDYGNMQKSDGDSGVWNNSYTEGFTKSGNNAWGVNNYCVTLTGMSGSSRDSYSDYYATVKENGKNIDKENGTITIRSVTRYRVEKKDEKGNTVHDDNGNIVYDTDASGNYIFDDSKDVNRNYTYYRYYTETGKNASTTRTIYGVYDMAGGSWEYMANSIEEGNGNVTELRKYLPNFATIYKGNSDDGKITGTQTDDGLGRLANYKANKEMYGDAVWETSCANQKGTDKDKSNGITDSDGERYNAGSSWNGDYSSFPRRVYPFFARGGNFGSSSNAGVFCFSSGYGGSSYYNGFRVVAL